MEDSGMLTANDFIKNARNIPKYRHGLIRGIRAMECSNNYLGRQMQSVDFPDHIYLDSPGNLHMNVLPRKAKHKKKNKRWLTRLSSKRQLHLYYFVSPLEINMSFLPPTQTIQTQPGYEGHTSKESQGVATSHTFTHTQRKLDAGGN